MIIQVSDHAERVDIISVMPVGKRIFLALLSLIPLLAPYELLWRVQWHDYWNPVFLLFAIVSVGAIAVSGLFLFAALAGLSSQMTFHALRSTFTYSERAPIVPQRTQVLPLSSIRSIHIRTQEWSDGSPSYSLRVTMFNGAVFDSGSSESRQEIEQAKMQVEAFLNRTGNF
ncbi:hypothetical protein NDA01_28910 [Trichocoleus desertorum AS-A10]|uniref:hypothetical protein n=1 Tax=Trichocoleus desertorum TaxID=1481672 RepID=UPI00329A493A